MNVVIIGNSAAGISAAETVRRLNKKAEITIISGESLPPYLRCLIYEVLSGKKNLSGIYYRHSSFFYDNRFNLINGRAVEIKPEVKKVFLDDGKELSYDRLLVCTGANPIPLDVDTQNIIGVSSLHTYQQAANAAILAKDAKTAVVVGGGLVGLKAAWGLTQRGIQVTVVEKASHILSRQLDEKSSSLVETGLTRLGVRFIYDTVPIQFITDKNNRVKKVVLENGLEIPSDLVISSRGVRPNTSLVDKAKGITAKGIVVNEYLSTSLPDIYAAGDCIEIPDALTGEKTPSGLWPLAVEQGRYAAYNLSGYKRLYPHPITNLNAAQISNVPFVSVGTINSEADHIISDECPKSYRKLIIKNDKLIGFIMAGVVENAGVYTSLIKSGKLISSKLKEKLFNGTLTGADLII